MPLGLIFFNTWFTDFFFQNIEVGGRKKIKIKITKNLKHIWIGGKKNNKNCIVISAFLQCKIIQFLLFLFKILFFFKSGILFASEEIKKVKNKILIFF